MMLLLLLLVYIIRSNGRILESWQISSYYTLITVKQQRHVEESKSFSEYPEYYHWVLFTYLLVYLFIISVKDFF